MEKLYNDVLENILFRLPLGEASSQAKRVCKSWKTILADRLHNMLGFLFVYRDIKNKKFKLFFGEEYDRIDCYTMNNYYSHETLMEMEHCRFDYKSLCCILVGSCNGLVCFQKKYPAGSRTPKPFAICNPLTGEFIYLKANMSRVWDEAYVVSSGFGYCHSTKEYKVVSFCTSIKEYKAYQVDAEKPRRSHVQVYTIGSNKWRDMELDISHTFVSSPGMFANGVLHWLDYDAYNGHRSYIAVFDLEDEKFQPLPLPPSEVLKCYDSYNHIMLLGGNLCWVQNQYKLRKKDIWAYKRNSNARYDTQEYDHKCDYYSKNSWSWVKEFSIHCAGYYYEPFAITKSNELLLYGWKNFYCYDPKTRTVNKLGDDGMDDDCSHIQAIPHKNSNVSLKDFGETWYGPGCSTVLRTNSYVSLAEEDVDVSLGSSTVLLDG